MSNEPHREGKEQETLGPGSPSLDSSVTQLHAKRRFKRMYHRVMSGLERDGNVRLLTLTSSVESPSDFQGSFRKLRMRLLRRKVLIDYIRCPELTKGGLRHEHILFRGSYIEQRYLSSLWSRIHRAEVVDIRKAWGKPGMAKYLGNYMAKSPASRYSYSWGWVWRGYAKSWRFLKRVAYQNSKDYHWLLTKWRIHVKMNIKPEDFYLEDYRFPDLRGQYG